MVEFERLGSAWREAARSRSGDLLALSLRLARVPCGPLECRPVTPEDELVAYVGEHGG
jgi:hypothetical protein